MGDGDSPESGDPRARYRRLPQPIRLSDTVATQDETAHAPEDGDDERDRRWLIRTVGLGGF